MPVQDLTPELRTHLKKSEFVVGVFVIVSILVLLLSLGIYVRKIAEQRGWFVRKAKFFTFVESAQGISEGDPVFLMGFKAGEITDIEAMGADDQQYNVFVEFIINDPYYGYIWTDSRARIDSGDVFGNRTLEVSKGRDGDASYKTDPESGDLLEVWDAGSGQYVALEKLKDGFWLQVEESQALTDRLDSLILQVEAILPQILTLTNQVSSAVTNANQMFFSVEQTITQTQPAISNLTQITAQLTDPNGSLGRWLLPEQLSNSVHQSLSAAHATLVSTDESIVMLSSNLNTSLMQLAGITSNLKNQVAVNTNILSEISSIVTNSDHLIQGLKSHWFLKSAFKEDTSKRWKSVEIRNH